MALYVFPFCTSPILILQPSGICCGCAGPLRELRRLKASPLGEHSGVPWRENPVTQPQLEHKPYDMVNSTLLWGEPELFWANLGSPIWISQSLMETATNGKYCDYSGPVLCFVPHQIHVCPEPKNLTWNRLFADVIKLRWCHTGLRWGLIQWLGS